MARDWALFLHLSGVLLFVGGSIGVTALRLLAIGKERPSESAVLLRAVRPLVPLVGTGLLLTLGRASGWPTSCESRTTRGGCRRPTC